MIDNASQKTTTRRQTRASGPEHQDATSTAAEHGGGAVSGELRGHPEHNMEDAVATPDGPLTILPSVEVAPAPEVESEFLTVSTSVPQYRDDSPADTNDIRITLDGESQPGPASIFGMFRNLRPCFARTFPGLTAIGLNVRWLPNMTIQTLRNEPTTSLLEEIEMLTIRPVRNMLRRNPRTSPPRRLPAVAPTSSPIAKGATGGSDVLKARLATPIRRSRSSYSAISQSRRTEASGRIDRTLYRLSDLLSQNQSTKTSPAPEAHQDSQIEETAPVDIPVTPKSHVPGEPMTAPAAATATDPDASPSFPRWIFNNLSRRWTSIRERWSTHPTVTNEDNMDVEQVATRSSPTTPPTAPVGTTTSSTPAPVGATTSTTSAPVGTTTSNTLAPIVATSEKVIPMPRTFFRPLRRASLHIPRRDGPRRPRRRRTSTTITEPRQVVAPARPEPAPETPSKLPYDLFPPGFSQELLDRCYAGSTRPRSSALSRNNSAAQLPRPVETTASLHDPETSQTPKIAASHEDQSLKRKREEPVTIPNPKGCSYGMDMDYFEFTDEEWAEEERRQAELAAAKETAAPAAKKQRVEEPRQPRRRIPSGALSPSRRPGFIPNRRGTYQAPDLPTIDSSGLLSDVVSSPAAPAQPAAEALPRTTGAPQAEKRARERSQASVARAAPETEISDASTGDSAQTPSPVRRARSKAEQFKPKTPSRLRESHRFSSSQTSASTGTPSQLSGPVKTPLMLSDPMSIDSSLGHVVTAEDVDWLHELCPGGDLEHLPWPDRMGLGESLGIGPSPLAIVGQVWNPELARQSSAAWKNVFGDYDNIM